MKHFLILIHILSIIAGIQCKCDDSCSCPDIRNLTFYPENILYTNLGLCLNNLTCTNTMNTMVVSRFTITEIPLPPGVSADSQLLITTMDSLEQPTGPPFDLFYYFGMICQDGAWYVTKYPMGIMYPGPGQPIFSGINADFDGKKTKIQQISCAPFE